MTRQLTGAIGLAGVLVAVGVAGVVRPGIEGRAGQIIFVPVPEINVPRDRTEPALEVWSCEEGPTGWTVTGHVDPSGGNPVIAVTGGMKGQPGARVGKAHAMDSAPSEFGEVGDFKVVLPWATGDSLFAVQGGNSAGDLGPTARCPKVKTG